MRKRKYFLTPSAKRDLDDIFTYISKDNPRAALKLVDALESRCWTLAVRPLLGHTRPDLLLPEDIRVFPVGSYLIVYRPHTKPLQIVRFWHAARRTPALS